MAAISMRGTVTIDGKPVPFAAGLKDYVALERTYGVDIDQLSTPKIEWIVFLAYSALKVPVPFDEWLDTVDDIDMADETDAGEA